MNTCKSCGAPIMWAETAKGHRIPIDPEPVLGGNILLSHRDVEPSLPPLATVFAHAFENSDEPTYKSHFATCPNASSHRRRNR